MKHECTDFGCRSDQSCGPCGGCSGCCGGELLLSKNEVSILLELAKYAFLPMIQITENEVKHYLPTPNYLDLLPEDDFSNSILSLERKHLVSIDPDIPLKNTDYGEIDGYTHARLGSLALTVQGQEALDWLSPSEFDL